MNYTGDYSQGGQSLPPQTSCDRQGSDPKHPASDQTEQKEFVGSARQARMEANMEKLLEKMGNVDTRTKRMEESQERMQGEINSVRKELKEHREGFHEVDDRLLDVEDELEWMRVERIKNNLKFFNVREWFCQLR